MPEEIEEEYHTDSEEENLEVEQLFQGLFAPLICWFAQKHWPINYFLIRKGANICNRLHLVLYTNCQNLSDIWNDNIVVVTLHQ